MQAHDWNDLLLEPPIKHKVVYTVGACLAAVLMQTTPPHALATPGATPPRPRLIAASADPNSPQVFTLRYVAFVAELKVKRVVDLNHDAPNIMDQRLDHDSRHAMTTTPEDFIKVLKAEQPNYNFNVGLAGSVVLYDTSATLPQITDGPNPFDPYGLTLVDNITINQNSDTTLDFVSQGTFSFRALKPSGDFGGKQEWKGENRELGIGRTYLWGATKKQNGNYITWAFCILPGRLDQVASTWKRHNGARATVLASDKTLERKVGQ